jgi:hypothetical protein
MSLIVRGIVRSGCQHFTRRMKKYPEVFKSATGVVLVPGTINVHIAGNQEIKIKEDFRMDDPMDANQVLLFEEMLINGISGFRIRPFNKLDGSGGHGDHVIEVSSDRKIPEISEGVEVILEFFRN